MFKLNYTEEYGDKIIMDTYNVNQNDVYTQWDDANGDHHRSIYKKRISGGFTMKFSNLAEYRAFIADIERFKTIGGFVRVNLAVNNIDEERNAKLYIAYQSIRTRNSNYTKGYLEFSVNVEEV